MTALTIIRNYRACMKASGIIPSDIPHISKINWTCQDHEGDHREREYRNNMHGQQGKVGARHGVVQICTQLSNKKEIQISKLDIVQ